VVTKSYALSKIILSIRIFKLNFIWLLPSNVFIAQTLRYFLQKTFSIRKLTSPKFSFYDDGIIFFAYIGFLNYLVRSSTRVFRICQGNLLSSLHFVKKSPCQRGLSSWLGSYWLVQKWQVSYLVKVFHWNIHIMGKDCHPRSNWTQKKMGRLARTNSRKHFHDLRIVFMCHRGRYFFELTRCSWKLSIKCTYRCGSLAHLRRKIVVFSWYITLVFRH